MASTGPLAPVVQLWRTWWDSLRGLPPVWSLDEDLDMTGGNPIFAVNSPSLRRRFRIIHTTESEADENRLVDWLEPDGGISELVIVATLEDTAAVTPRVIGWLMGS